MTTLRTIATLLVFTVTLPIFGQNASDNKAIEPYIEVTGTAEKEIIPDEIYISMTIHERNEGKEKITINKQEEDLKEALKSIEVPIENLFLSEANADYIRVKWSKKDVISKSEYLLKVGDALTVGKVFEKLDELKIMNAYISRVNHSKLDEIKKEVRIMAIKAAKEKADYLLNAIGEKTGKAIKVYEQPSSYNINNDDLNIRGSRSGSQVLYIDGINVRGRGEDFYENIIQFQKIKLQSAIYVKFKID